MFKALCQPTPKQGRQDRGQQAGQGAAPAPQLQICLSASWSQPLFDFDVRLLTCNPLNLMTTQCGKENRTTINNGRFSGHETTPMFSHQIRQSASWTQPSSYSCWLGPNLSNTASYEKDSLCLKNPCKRKIQQWRMTMCAPLQYFLCPISIVVGERGSQECNAKMETVHTYFVCICILYTSNYL